MIAHTVLLHAIYRAEWIDAALIIFKMKYFL